MLIKVIKKNPIDKKSKKENIDNKIIMPNILAVVVNGFKITLILSLNKII